MAHELVLVEGPVAWARLRDEGVLDPGGPQEVLGTPAGREPCAHPSSPRSTRSRRAMTGTRLTRPVPDRPAPERLVPARGPARACPPQIGRASCRESVEHLARLGGGEALERQGHVGRER